FDIYLTDLTGTKLFGLNRQNNWGDPIEVLPFTVTADVLANIVITRTWTDDPLGPPMKIKYIIFRGDATILEHQAGSSTIIGQANCDGAMSVGAVRYTKTPAFGQVPEPESFTSRGGTAVRGVVRNKPDFSAPNGVNTSVNFFSRDLESDGLYNFYGTSCAAPHAAGAAALIQQAAKKFNDAKLSPDSLRNLMKATAVDIGGDGFDLTTGAGLINPMAAVRTFARPLPQVDTVIPDLPSAVFGQAPVSVTVVGDHFVNGAEVYLDGAALPTVYQDEQHLLTEIPTFIGNPMLQVFNSPSTSNGTDGGYSNGYYFYYNPEAIVTVRVDNTTKRYGESLPEFTATILVDGQPLDSTGLSLEDLGLEDMHFLTQATELSP
ncbi:MAG TPA: S8 family serine peptidase, partial [Bacteroidia bacterium]|nr:S8 family serine peptidase [Bacteroidia bacterium]